MCRYVYICMYTCMYVYIYICIYMHMYPPIYTYVHMYLIWMKDTHRLLVVLLDNSTPGPRQSSQITDDTCAD